MVRTKTVVVFDKEQYDGEWPPTDAAGALAWFAAKVAEVPAEFRHTAKIEIEGVTSYDSGYARILITYRRAETAEEVSARKQQEDAEVDRLRAQELRTLAALQAKYGKPGA